MTEPIFWPWSGVYAAVVIVLCVIAWIVNRARPGRGRRLALLLSVLAAIVYLTWRITFTIPMDTLASQIAGIVLISAEVIGFAALVMSSIIGWQGYHRRVVELSALTELPSIDIFIATYSESLTVLEPTLAGAMGIRYPGVVTVYLCDDGSRPEVRELAERYGATHREREDHSHAKAGNLNNALAHSTGELIVTLDADMIPTEDFLEKTVGYFSDGTVGFVQAPQAFYNQDAFQYNLFAGDMLPNEQDYFMRSLQPGKEKFNAVMYVGSNTVFKRAALDAIGGFATGVITEDMATGMLLQAAGYRTLFVPDIIAAGLAPESFSDLLTQRIRWARGNIQTARAWNPLTLKGLSPMQRLIYTDGIVFWHFGIFKLIYIIAPLVYLIGAIPVVHADLSSILVIWLPYFVASIVSVIAISQGRRSFSWTHVYEIAMGPTIALAVISEWLGFSIKRFAVTPKGVSNEKLNFRWTIALPHIVLLAASIFGLLNAFVFSAGQFASNSLVITAFWTVYNIVGLAMAILVCLERPRQRATERTAVDARAQAVLWNAPAVPCRVRDLSFTGARLLLPWTATFDREATTRPVAAATRLAIDGVGVVAGSVRWVSEAAEGLLVGFSFDSMPPEQTIPLVHLITSSPDWVRHDREEHARMAAAAARTLTGAARRVNPALRTELRITTRDIAELAPLSDSPLSSAFSVHVEDLSYGGARVRSRRPLTLGDRYRVALSENGRSATAEVRWVQRRRGVYVAGLKFERANESAAS